MQPKTFIRDYRPDDYPGVQQVWEATSLGGQERGDDAEVIRRTLDLGGRLLVMEEESSGRIIGTSWLTYNGRRVYIHHFGILPEYQNRGLGKNLAEESVKIAKEKGVQIKLEVHRENKVAIHLYRELGFKYLGDYVVYIIRNIF